MNIVAILQARMGSTRLPGKVMLPLAGEPLVDQVYFRTARATCLHRTIVAMPKQDYNAVRLSRIPFNDFFLYDGDENDLVGRYLAAATRYQADLIVRVPCDNPCIDPEYIDAAIKQYLTGNYIFYTNTQEWTCGEHIDGIGCEVFSMSRLKLLDILTQGEYAHTQGYREHPHRWFYDHLNVWKPDPTIRLDVNTQADYEFIKTIYDHFGHNRFTTEDVVQLLASTRVS